MKDIFITGISTEIGKTVTSAIFARALGYDYWKPIQCGSLEKTDTHVIREIVPMNISRVYPETYIFEKPASPHIAAGDQIIDLDAIKRPSSKKALIIEGAGGVLVPINHQHYMLDLIQHLGCHLVVVSKNYLGSINHTLLTLEAIKNRGLSILGIVFNGQRNKESENSILDRSNLPKLLNIEQEETVNAPMVIKYAKILKKSRFVVNYS